MFDLFEFDLTGIVTRQVQERLSSMPSSNLTQQALVDLAEQQPGSKPSHGIYQLLLNDRIVYVWKATDVRKRLDQHLRKLSGRKKIRMADVNFRCLLMHRNWSTIASEDLLITHYKSLGLAEWNGSGFGPKDVGKGRDETEPNWFDREYPINADYPCVDIPNSTTVGELLKSLKAQLPFTFRYEVPAADGAKPLNLKSVPRNARALVAKAVTALGTEWQATIFVSHIILYKERRAHKHGQSL